MDDGRIWQQESWKRLTTFPYRVGDDSSGNCPRLLRVLAHGLLLVVHEGKIVLCDSKNNTWKNITSYKWTPFYQSEVGLYIETLVSPRGGDKLTSMYRRRVKAIMRRKRRISEVSFLGFSISMLFPHFHFMQLIVLDFYSQHTASFKTIACPKLSHATNLTFLQKAIDLW